MFSLFKSKKNGLKCQDDDNTYGSLRKMAFEVKPAQLGVNLENDEQVYGAIIDMSVSNGKTATMVCFIDGTASVYFSSGGGIIGAGQHANVKQAVGSFLISVHQVLPIMKLVDLFDKIPRENHQIFYLFTRAGIYSLDLDVNESQNTRETHFLFSISQMVLSEIRKTNV